MKEKIIELANKWYELDKEDNCLRTREECLNDSDLKENLKQSLINSELRDDLESVKETNEEQYDVLVELFLETYWNLIE